MKKVIRHGECPECLDDDLDLFEFDGEVICYECGYGQIEQEQLEASQRENYLKYEAEEWMPEDGFDDND